MAGQGDAHASTRTGWIEALMEKGRCLNMVPCIRWSFEFCLIYSCQLAACSLSRRGTAWHCLSLLVRVMSMDTHGLILLADINQNIRLGPCKIVSHSAHT